MARETKFVVPYDVPTTPQAKIWFKQYLIRIREQYGPPFGETGKKVGFGFVWESHSAIEGTIHRLSKRMLRALKASGIVSHFADVFLLEQRIDYIRDGDCSVTFTLIEREN